MLELALAARYPGTSEGEVALRESAIAICTSHVRSNLSDKNIISRLCSPDQNIYWQALSEVLAAYELGKIGFQPISGKDGPDLFIVHEGKRIWIEVICPEPASIPECWLTRQPDTVYSLPHEAMLLRWTAAIKEKSEKLMGPRDDPAKGYLGKGRVAKEDSYVIAINGRLLRTVFPELEGVSQLPFAVEATFSVGPNQITINRETKEMIGTGHLHRPSIPKPNGAQVPADTFLDPHFAPVSAVWAMDVDENALRDRPVRSVVVHNPQARNPVPLGLFPVEYEYVSANDGDFYQLDRLQGRLCGP